jgi:hypothetical protein
MVRKMFWREWKEKRDFFIFALAGIALYLVAFSYFSQKKDLLDILTGAVTLIFLPFIGLLLGSSGFAAEFKGDSWAYLFSRPVKKSTIWLTKYFALMTILAAVLIIFIIATRLVPTLGTTVAELDLKNLGLGMNQRVSFMSLGFLLSWILMTISFSLSFLSEKQYAVIFLTCLIWAALEFGLFQFILFVLVPITGYFPLRLIGPFSFALLIPLSFALASLLSFARTDFSQPRKKVRDFAKLELPFLAAALLLCSVLTAAGALRERGRRISDLEIQDAAIYFATQKKILCFDMESNRLQALAQIRLPSTDISIGGQKLAFTRYTMRSKYHLSEDLWVMNIDGTDVASLRVTSREGSPFYDTHLYPFMVSPDGRRVAFAAKDYKKRRAEWLIGFVNTDGTELKSYSLDIPDIYWIQFAGWTPEARDLLIFTTPSIRASNKGTKLLRVNFETGATEVLAEHILRPTGGQLSRNRLIAFISRDEIEAKQVLTLLDIESLDRWDIHRASSIDGSKWAEDGSRLAFLADKHTLGIYSLATKKVIALREFKGLDFGLPGLTMDWVLDGDGLAIREFREGEGRLALLNPDLSEKKTIPIPFTANQVSRLGGVDESVIIFDWGTAQLWLLDLNTEKWRKIY